MRIRGVIERGAGKGASFVGLDWVVEQIEKAMGFKPYPGTLNIRVLEADLPELERFFSEKDFTLVPDDPRFCSADVKRITVNGILAAAVFPSEDVRIHGKTIVEIIATCHMKEALGLIDGDMVVLEDAGPS